MTLNQQRVIREVLRSMGLIGESLSLRQLVCAVELAHTEPELLRRITKGLYPAVAAHFDQATPATVERNLRLIRDHQWNKGDQERLREMAGFPHPCQAHHRRICGYYLLLHGGQRGL